MLDSANMEQKTPVAEVLQSEYSEGASASASGSSASQSKSKKVSHLSLNTINTYEWKLIKGKLEDWSEKNQDTFDELITLWIGGSNHPVSLLDSPEFRAVIGHANSKVELSLPIFLYILTGVILQVKVPGSKKVNELIGKTSDKILKHVKVCLQQCRQITITTDLWSTRCSNQSYIGVTSHAFNPKARKRQSFKLCKYFLLN